MPIVSWAAGPEPILLLFVALVVDGLVPEPRRLYRVVPHPVIAIGAAVGWLDRRLNRPERSDRDRVVRGTLVVILLGALAGLAGWSVGFLVRHLPFGWIAELVFVVVLLAQRSLFKHVRAVVRPLENDDLSTARDAVSHIVGRDPANLDRHGIARGAVESLAENYADAVVAPAFWYVLLGLPGLFIYKAVNTMDSMIGHPTARYASFGMVAARLDDVLNYLPARLSGLLLAIAALFTPTANPMRALYIMSRDARKHRSVNAGWPEGAMAGALELSLAGPRRYTDHVVEDNWIGEGSARLEPRDVRRALYLFVVACVINAGVVGAFGLASAGY